VTAGRVSRPFNRLRVLLDRSVTAANALDLAHRWHPDSDVFHLDASLPYRRLPGPVISPRLLLPFVNRVGNTLVAAGMRPGDRVGIFKLNAPDYFFLALAIVKAGGIAVPVNPNMGLADLRSHLEHTGVRILITDETAFWSTIRDPRTLPMVERWIVAGDSPGDFPVPCISLNAAVECSRDVLAPARIGPETGVIIAHTSGTTGPAKRVLVTSAGLVSGLKAHYPDEPITRRNRTGVAGHFSHLVYYVGFYSSLLGNLPVWTVSDFAAERILDLIERERVTIFFAFPDLYASMYHHGLDERELRSMRIWVTTADACHEMHMHAFCRKGAYLRVLGVPLFRAVFIEALGSSETGFAALRRFRFSFSPLRSDRIIGRPSLAGPAVKIADEQGRRLRRNAIGRLMVKGPTLFAGYWNAGQLVPVTDRHGWWWTGDVAYRDRLGRFHHLDRAADAIDASHGLVFTLPIEDVLLGYPDVSEAKVVGLPCDGEHDVPVAFVVARPEGVVDPARCRSWANAQLAPTANLHEVRVVGPGDLPRGNTGKVLKRALRERHETGSSCGRTTDVLRSAGKPSAGNAADASRGQPGRRAGPGFD
jgi:long-chain acyl-CoA synthetase